MITLCIKLENETNIGLNKKNPADTEFFVLSNSGSIAAGLNHKKIDKIVLDFQKVTILNPTQIIDIFRLNMIKGKDTKIMIKNMKKNIKDKIDGLLSKYIKDNNKNAILLFT